VVIEKRPGDVSVLGARATAYVHADRIDEALDDLDKVIAADADPKWRRLRKQQLSPRPPL